MTTYTVISSAFRATATMEVNYVNHNKAVSRLVKRNMCDIKTVLGVYHEEGQLEATKEVSIVNSNLSHDEVKQCVSIFCDYFCQDCILAINDETGECVLISQEWQESIGYWTEVSQKEAHDSGIYSLDTNGKYWIAK